MPRLPALRGKRKRPLDEIASGPKRSSELKLSRAQHHLDEVSAMIVAWCADSGGPVEEGVDREHPGMHGAWINPAPPFPADTAAMIVGDCVQCFRASLDHLAFELSSAFSSPLPKSFVAPGFPIVGDNKDAGYAAFHQLRRRGARTGEPAPGSGLAKTEAMNPEAQAIIEGLQPYHRDLGFTDDPLWRLHELSQIDSERALRIAGWSAVGTIFKPRDAENVSFTGSRGFIEGLANRVDGRTQVARWASDMFTAVDPTKEMRVNFRPTLSVNFDEATPGLSDVRVIDVLTEINDLLANTIFPALIPLL